MFALIMWRSGMITIEEIKNRVEIIARLTQKYIENNFVGDYYEAGINDISEILRRLVVLRHDIYEDKEAHILAEDCHEYV